MDPQLWANLPPDLYPRILAHLPIRTLFRFRSVCKIWNTLPLNPTFIRLSAQIPTLKDSWLVMFSDNYYRTVSVFLPDQNKWFDFPISFLPSELYYVAGAGGLLCFHLTEANGASSMCVCNPLIKQWKKLPPLLCDFYGGLVGMVADSLSYQIVVRTKPARSDRFDFSNLKTEIYDSRTSCWRISGIPEDDFTSGQAVSNGVLYFLTWEARNGVYAYNMDQGLWETISAPRRHRFISPCLVECRGRLFMVGGFAKQQYKTLGIRVWELQQDRSEWELTDSMPSLLFDEFLTKSGSMYFICVGHKQQIYLINRGRPPRILRFDPETCLWQLVATDAPDVLHELFLLVSFTPTLNCLV
ncbi:hypothetical protein O6H91_12G005800 [Diphasiastrum complanatum]|nr:hypothetical protein O6H91_12G005800 [Diphasiastrum complanatum]